MTVQCVYFTLEKTFTKTGDQSTMNKHTIIVIIASIFIIAPIAFSFWNIYAASQLQIKWSNPEGFTLFDMIYNKGKFSICNPLPFFVNINSIDIKTYYNEDSKGTSSTQNVVIPPYSESDIAGKFKSENFAESQYLFMHMDAEFAGTAQIRIDPTKFFVVIEYHTPIINVIPFSVSKEYTGFDFSKMMNGELENFNCET